MVMESNPRKLRRSKRTADKGYDAIRQRLALLALEEAPDLSIVYYVRGGTKVPVAHGTPDVVAEKSFQFATRRPDVKLEREIVRSSRTRPLFL